jgi:methylated-DNA-[protein]-cysteine S-methyltransferase
MTSYSTLRTPQGKLLLVARETELIGLYFDECAHVPSSRAGWILNPRHPVLKNAAEQLQEYFEGKRTAFTLPLAFSGTDFQERVWRAIARIPHGETISYGELAQRAGNPGAVRAAGTNTGRNPIGIIIPCHRVMGKGGGIGGFAGGLAWKRYLLELEYKVRSADSLAPLQQS